MGSAFCRYGRTGGGKLVDSSGLQLLENMGFERALAAEALKQVHPLGAIAQCDTDTVVDILDRTHSPLHGLTSPMTWGVCAKLHAWQCCSCKCRLRVAPLQIQAVPYVSQLPASEACAAA